jgi:2-polyprenyl-3-methyl-5-hydroxy-6-metoxy-1,4-benzoquinol methylase
MSEPKMQAQIDSAKAYEELFVPALFQEWAPRVVLAAQIQSGHRVLDVACGTGVLAREAASCVGSTGFVAGVDPNPGMLAVAARLTPGVEWHQGTAESLRHGNDAIVGRKLEAEPPNNSLKLTAALRKNVRPRSVRRHPY